MESNSPRFLHLPSLPRIEAGQIGGPQMVGLFEQLVEAAVEANEAVADLMVGYFDTADTFIPGTYVPELHLVVRRVDNDAEEDIL